MREKPIGIILDIVSVISMVGFIATLVFNQTIGVGSALKGFALSWLFIYLFAVSLGFRGNLDAHRDALRRFSVEWIIACLVGALLTVFVLIVG
jgi:hypothetical protein